MSTANNLFKSSIARTSFTVIGIIVAFFMMPFIVGKLGDEWYGVWTVLGSLMGYYYLVDFGLATAVTRYVAEQIAKNDKRSANEIINTSLIIYSIMAVVIFLLALLTAYFADYFIHDAGNLHIIRVVVLILGLNLALEFPYKAFAGVISAYARYDLLTYAHFVTYVFGVALTVIFLNKGYGILALSIIGLLCSQLLRNVCFPICESAWNISGKKKYENCSATASGLSS